MEWFKVAETNGLGLVSANVPPSTILIGTEKAMRNLYHCNRFPPHDLNQGSSSKYNEEELSTIRLTILELTTAS
jgi:hypothetical protein